MDDLSMDEIISIAQKLGALGFGTLVTIALIGNYYGIWMWGKQHREREKELLTRIMEEREEKLKWISVTMGLKNVAGTAVDRLGRE